MDYLGVTLSLNKRLANRWSMRGHVTWPTGTGRSGRSTASTTDPTDQISDDLGFADGDDVYFEQSGSNKSNVLVGSRWSFNLNGLYQVAPEQPWGFNLGASLDGREGYISPPYVRRSGSVGRRNVQLTEDIDEFRNDDVYVFNAHADKDFTFGETAADPQPGRLQPDQPGHGPAGGAQLPGRQPHVRHQRDPEPARVPRGRHVPVPVGSSREGERPSLPRSARIQSCMRAVLAVLGCPCASLPCLSAAPLPADARDVLLVTIDTLRADALGLRRQPRRGTPMLDRLAARGASTPRARAQRGDPAVPRQHPHRALSVSARGARQLRLPCSRRRCRPSPPSSRGDGYATGAFVGAYPLDSELRPRPRLRRLRRRSTRGSRAEDFVIAERRGDEVVGAALEVVAGAAAARRFLWVHLYDPHAPYEPPEPFAAPLRDKPYLGEVAAADHSWRRCSRRSSTARSRRPHRHHRRPWRGARRARRADPRPLRLRVDAARAAVGLAPGGRGRPGRPVGAARRHLPDHPRARSASSRRRSPPGRSLLAAPDAGENSYFESLSTNLNRGWAPLRGMLRGGGKWIDLPLPELYDLRRPGESKNLVDRSGARPPPWRGAARRSRSGRRARAVRRGEGAAAQPRLRRRRGPGEDRATARTTTQEPDRLDRKLHRSSTSTRAATTRRRRRGARGGGGAAGDARVRAARCSRCASSRAAPTRRSRCSAGPARAVAEESLRRRLGLALAEERPRRRGGGAAAAARHDRRRRTR